MLSKKLIETIVTLLDSANYIKARQLIYQNIEKYSQKDTKANFLKVASLHGYLIDLGCESKTETDLNKAIKFLETNEEKILTYLAKESYYYNLANAKHGISRIYIEKNRGFPTLKIVSDKLQPPINLYWLAFKNLISDNDSLKSQVLINLSNSLIEAGRIIECIQFLDTVLLENPNYPQALISRADALSFLSHTANCSYTVSLFYEIYKSYNDGINTGALPDSLLHRCIAHRNQAQNQIIAYGFKIEDLDAEIVETQREFNNHSEYRKFALLHFLSLNEHAVYCPCVSARHDDLQIGVQHAKFKGTMVPKLELLLNRIKSEFALARLLLFQSQTEINQDKSMLYSELLDGEVIGTETEMLRTSFRICYGILDKIALGICKYYKLSEDGEAIYFERFWNPGKKSDRWEKLNNINNIHLSALYCIACDLNTSIGELKHFKSWRNKLEHKVLTLKDDRDSPDTLKLFEDKDFVSVEEINDFTSKTLHLLQLTRAAMFSFVYCIRFETIRPRDDSDDGFMVDFKK